MISKIKFVSKALGMTDTFVGTSRAFIMIVGLGYVVNNEDVIMRVTGTEPVYTRFFERIREWD